MSMIFDAEIALILIILEPPKDAANRLLKGLETEQDRWTED